MINLHYLAQNLFSTIQEFKQWVNSPLVVVPIKKRSAGKLVSTTVVLSQYKLEEIKNLLPTLIIWLKNEQNNHSIDQKQSGDNLTQFVESLEIGKMDLIGIVESLKEEVVVIEPPAPPASSAPPPALTPKPIRAKSPIIKKKRVAIIQPKGVIICIIPDCEEDLANKQHKICKFHYDRLRNTGSYDGRKDPRKKLTKEQEAAIRKDKRVNRIIAKEYGISGSLVSITKRNKHWR